MSASAFVFVEYANPALRDVNLQKRKTKRIQQEINVLLIMVKTIYDKANFAPFHKTSTREPYLMRETVLFNLS